MVRNKMGNIACLELDLVVDVAIRVVAKRSLHTDIRDELLLATDVRVGVLLLLRDVIVVALVNRFPRGLQAHVFLNDLGDMVIARFLIDNITMRNDTLVTSTTRLRHLLTLSRLSQSLAKGRRSHWNREDGAEPRILCQRPLLTSREPWSPRWRWCRVGR